MKILGPHFVKILGPPLAASILKNSEESGREMTRAVLISLAPFLSVEEDLLLVRMADKRCK